jgi:transposase
MQAITTVGFDIAKSVFQVHGVDTEGQVVIRRQLKRRYVVAFFQKLPPWLVGIEACASSHHWSRELKALGHTVRLMPPAYVKPYVKRQKKQGDRHLRSLFVAGALAVIRYAKIPGIKHRPWLTALLARRPTKVAAIALVNKIARMAWAKGRMGWPVTGHDFIPLLESTAAAGRAPLRHSDTFRMRSELDMLWRLLVGTNDPKWA